MKPFQINVVELLNSPNAILHKFGLQLYQAVEPHLASGQNVIIDFSGMRNATTGFFHASVGKLYQEFSDQFDTLVEVKGIEQNSDWLDKFNNAINLVKNPDKANEIDSAIAELFAS